MPEIYPPAIVANKEYPKVQEIQEAANAVKDAVARMHEKGEVVSASSLGSLFDPDRVPVIGSDIDWMIIFANLKAMLGSADFTEMLKDLQNKKVPFHNPVLSLDSIQSRNYMIAPILHGMRRSTHRVITGEDPIDVFERHGTKKNDREMISRIFASYTRYFFEEIATHGFAASENTAILASLLEKALNFYRETYRSMIVACLGEDDYSKPLNFDSYQELYTDKMSSESIQQGTDVENFLKAYDTFMAERDQSEVSAEEIGRNYEDFLRKHSSVVLSSALFSQANIQHFRSHIAT